MTRVFMISLNDIIYLYCYNSGWELDYVLHAHNIAWKNKHSKMEKLDG